jgi:hypothetical protein
MPRITARDPAAAQMRCFNEDGTQFGSVTAFDTQEGWLEFIPIYPTSSDGYRPVIVDRKTQEMVTVRVHTSYEIRHRQTNELLHKVVWDSSGNKVQ